MSNSNPGQLRQNQPKRSHFQNPRNKTFFSRKILFLVLEQYCFVQKKCSYDFHIMHPRKIQVTMLKINLHAPRLANVAGLQSNPLWYCWRLTYPISPRNIADPSPPPAGNDRDTHAGAPHKEYMEGGGHCPTQEAHLTTSRSLLQ